MMYILRGVSGSGKSTFAEKLAEALGAMVVSADHFFEEIDGEYKFDPRKLPEAHKFCQERAAFGIEMGVDVIVDNTNTCRWEMEPYLKLAAEFNVLVTVIHVQGQFENVHGVGADIVQKQMERFEHDWQSADPRAPWLRK